MIVKSLDHLKSLSKKVADILQDKDKVFLIGEIGVGKTTFAKYLINQFQINKKIQTTEVLSPTFNLLNEYQVNDLVIKHYDLFRLKDKLEIKNLDIFENSKNSITLIEWPQLIDKEKSIKSINLHFNYEDKLNNRSITINGLS